LVILGIEDILDSEFWIEGEGEGLKRFWILDFGFRIVGEILCGCPVQSVIPNEERDLQTIQKMDLSLDSR
jgi:hypothetical protein